MAQTHNCNHYLTSNITYYPGIAEREETSGADAQNTTEREAEDGKHSHVREVQP